MSEALAMETMSAEETKRIGARLGQALQPGDVLALCGPLGSGKTVLVQGLARGLGTNPGVLVTSPSFVILHEYPGRLPLYHFDFYRLGKEREVHELGFEEYFDGDGVCAVEWADKFPGLFGARTLWLEFQRSDESQRRIGFRPGEDLRGLRWPKMAKAIQG